MSGSIEVQVRRSGAAQDLVELVARTQEFVRGVVLPPRTDPTVP